MRYNNNKLIRSGMKLAEHTHTHSSKDNNKPLCT